MQRAHQQQQTQCAGRQQRAQQQQQQQQQCVHTDLHALQQHEQQYNQLQQLQQHKPHRTSRRAALAGGLATAAAAAAVLALLPPPPPAQAYLVDETAAQGVFALASRSVVSINDYGATHQLEGVGTGFVWSKYGHSECVRPGRVARGAWQLPLPVHRDDGCGPCAGPVRAAASP
jgi:hypothetical protein